MITIRTNLDRSATLVHPHHAGFSLPAARTTSAGFSELRLKF